MMAAGIHNGHMITAENTPTAVDIRRGARVADIMERERM